MRGHEHGDESIALPLISTCHMSPFSFQCVRYGEEAFPVFLRENKFLIGTSLTNPHILLYKHIVLCMLLLTVELCEGPGSTPVTY